jgi:predicted HTH transcriptional regulator
MAEWTTENEFDRPSTAQVPSKYRSGKWHEKNGTATITELTDRQLVIFETIKNGTVNAQNLSVALGISLRTTKRDLYVLRDMNLIHYVGSDKTGHWEVIKESD